MNMSKFSICKYQYRVMKSIKLFKKGRGEYLSIKEGLNLIKVHYMPIWKYHNEIHLYSQYTLIKNKSIHTCEV
jgi:hypothetical protein